VRNPFFRSSGTIVRQSTEMIGKLGQKYISREISKMGGWEAPAGVDNEIGAASKGARRSERPLVS
jgi:hypothetical protein